MWQTSWNLTFIYLQTVKDNRHYKSQWQCQSYGFQRHCQTDTDRWILSTWIFLGSYEAKGEEFFKWIMIIRSPGLNIKYWKLNNTHNRARTLTCQTNQKSLKKNLWQKGYGQCFRYNNVTYQYCYSNQNHDYCCWLLPLGWLLRSPCSEGLFVPFRAKEEAQWYIELF